MSLMTTPVSRLLGLAAGVALTTMILPRLAADGGRAPTAGPVVRVPYVRDQIATDGRMNEPCYRSMAVVSQFVVAAEPARAPARTKAYLGWDEDRLVVAFDCDDADLVAMPASGQERDVNRQDRVEVFLWSGREAAPYFCLEIGARGAVHDYAARFYRKFDDGWSPDGWTVATQTRPGGYVVELTLSRSAMRALGYSLEAGTSFRCGLFRADFATGRPNDPDWITWIEPGTPRPDFHVPGAFGTIVLEPAR